MSLDLSLFVKDETANKPESIGTGIFIRRDGQNVEITREEWDRISPGVEPAIFIADESDDEDSRGVEVFDGNITHNLGKMAREAGLYDHMWLAHDKIASDLIEPLTIGISELEDNREKYEEMNPSNGWGSYDGLVKFSRDFLKACVENPSAVAWALG